MAAKKAAKPSTNTTQVNEWAAWFRSLGNKYGDLNATAVRAALERASQPFKDGFNIDPNVQNRRVKQISSLPIDTQKNEIVKMLQKPDDNEIGLRQVSNILEYTAYPLYKIRQVYQDLLTYHHYVYPAFATKEDTKKPEFLREWRLVAKLEEEMQCSRNARMIVGQCVRDGKVFYVPRVKVDKSHNQIETAFMQQLPQDWTKIAGFNSLSKYTVAFDMMYFLQPGASINQFGKLFEPYIDDFLQGFDNEPKVSPRGVIMASKRTPNHARMLELQRRSAEGLIPGTPEIYNVNGKRWFYWVYLPADKVWTFEIDDVRPVVVSPLTGLMLSMAQIAQYEDVQLELVQNPLVSILTGQLETYDAITPTESDPIKVSPTGREMFQTMFYQMLAANNTGGVGIFSAPFKDMKLQQLAEAPNATNISSKGYEYAMEKSGLSALIPTTSDARAGVAQISLMIESQYGKHIYWQFERMMDDLLDKLNLQFDWKFHMFGSLADDKTMNEEMVKSMSLGILPNNFAYNAMHGRTMLDDMSMSYAVESLDLLEERKPLITSYSAKNGDGMLPPKGGRPASEEITSDGQEADADDAKSGGIL